MEAPTHHRAIALVLTTALALGLTHVPHRHDPPPTTQPTTVGPPPAASTHGDEPLDLNSASALALERLPGIGPALALRIVTERTARGPFRSIDDLARVRGIGPRTVARIAPLVVIT